MATSTVNFRVVEDWEKQPDHLQHEDVAAVATDSQGRVLELTRQLIDEFTDSQRDARDTLRRVIEANRGAGQAAIEATRDAVTRAGSAVQNIRSTDGARATPGPRKSRETSDTSA